MILLRVLEIEGIYVITPSGNLDMEVAGKFKEFASEWCMKSKVGVVIDLREVDYMDSIGVGSIVSVFSRCVSSGKRMALVLSEGNVKKLITMTKLDRLMDIYDEISRAVNSLK